MRYTRKEYLRDCKHPEKREELHRKYYSQFVDQAVKKQVMLGIGLGNLLNSTCPHFNDILIHHWYALNISPAKPMEYYGDFFTLGGKVCIAKEAAHQIVEEYRNGTCPA